MTILVIDGQGGKLGKSLVESIKKAFPQTELMAIGTNSAAAEAMRRAGADQTATGEIPFLWLAAAHRSSSVLSASQLLTH